MRPRIEFSQHPQLPFEEWQEDALDNDLSNQGQAGKTDIDYKKQDSKKQDSGEIDLTEDDITRDRLSERSLNFISLGSGSSGNCCYIGTKKGGILVDAGVKTEDVVKVLASHGVSMNSVKALLLTHDHADHVRYAYNILRSHKHIRLFCTNRVLNGILRRHSISKRIKEYHNPIFKEIPFKVLDFEITAFEVPHDGSDNMGFSIEFDSRRFVLATDLGAITERAYHYMSRANYLVIEANYDLSMLLHGRYPEYLKARIQTQNGHMDNKDTAQFLCDIINPELKYIFLCHLSKDNNTPEKALSTIRDALESAGKKVGSACETILDREADVQLMALPRFDPTNWFVFRPFNI